MCDIVIECGTTVTGHIEWRPRQRGCPLANGTSTTQCQSQKLNHPPTSPCFNDCTRKDVPGAKVYSFFSGSFESGVIACRTPNLRFIVERVGNQDEAVVIMLRYVERIRKAPDHLVSDDATRLEGLHCRRESHNERLRPIIEGTL